MSKHAAEIFTSALSTFEDYIEDPATTEIMVNGNCGAWIKRRGQMSRLNIPVQPEHIGAAILSLATYTRQDVTSNTAILHGHFDKLRVAAVRSPVSYEGDALCIRKHGSVIGTLEDFEAKGGFDPPCINRQEDLVRLPDESIREYLVRAIVNRRTILISGGTDSGKTSFANKLLALVPPHERLVLIEDTLELQTNAPNRLRLLANENFGAPIRELVATSLRLRPDRIILGEIRKEEAYDLLQAMNTGHAGTISTLHANNAVMALHRFSDLVMTGVPTGGAWPTADVRRAVASAVHLVVHCASDPATNRYFIREIASVEGATADSFRVNYILREERQERYETQH